jgi:hypothetical protein
MKARQLILATIFLLPAIGAGYMTWLMWQAGDSGKWLFLVFTVFFALMALAPFLPKPKPKPQTFTSTRFVPHWFMMLAVLVLLLSIILAIVGAFLRH